MNNKITIFQIFLVAAAAIFLFHGDYVLTLLLLIYERALAYDNEKENKKDNNNKKEDKE